MGKERVIFSNRFDRPTLEQIEEEMKKENYDDNENLMSAEEFLDFMKKNRRTIPNERRIANKDKFIWAVRELSETYEIDADLIEDDDGYTASLYIFADNILTVVNAVFVVNVLNPEGNKDSKAFCGKGSECVNLACSKGHSRIQSVHLLILENRKLAQMLSCSRKQSFGVVIKLFFGVRSMNHSEYSEHH